jgi:hypothetical protein
VADVEVLASPLWLAELSLDFELKRHAIRVAC